MTFCERRRETISWRDRCGWNLEGAIYHLLARGNARQRIFASDRDRTEFLRLLEASASRFDGLVHAFVVMGNHFHLLAQTRQPNLSRWMHWLMVSYTTHFNWQHGRSGHLFQGRYKSFVVEGGSYLLGLSRYLHLNPVRGASLGAAHRQSGGPGCGRVAGAAIAGAWVGVTSLHSTFELTCTSSLV